MVVVVVVVEVVVMEVVVVVELAVVTHASENTKKARAFEGYTKGHVQSVSRVACGNAVAGGGESERSSAFFIFHLTTRAVRHQDR